MTQQPSAIEFQKLKESLWSTKDELESCNFKNQQLRTENAALREALDKLLSDCTASDFNEHWDSYKGAIQALTQTGGKE